MQATLDVMMSGSRLNYKGNPANKDSLQIVMYDQC